MRAAQGIAIVAANLEGAVTQTIEAARLAFAQELGRRADISDAAIIAAFARVPREAFVGPPPWRVGGGGLWPTLVDDPRALYTDTLVALDEALGVNNGQPSLWASVFAAVRVTPGARVVHLGAGTGYYAAILAELVGPAGAVAAYEMHPGLVARARVALAPWPQVTLHEADGARAAFAPADVIVASAGATHPAPHWLDALKDGGRLTFPLTGAMGSGAMLLVTRLGEAFAARFLFAVAFMDFAGLRDPETARRLDAAFRHGRLHAVQSLRRGPPEADAWLTGDGWSLSPRPPDHAARNAVSK